MKESCGFGLKWKRVRKRGKSFPMKSISHTPHRKPTSSISKENVDEARKLFRGIVLRQAPEKGVFRERLSTFLWKSVTQTCPY